MFPISKSPKRTHHRISTIGAITSKTVSTNSVIVDLLLGVAVAVAVGDGVSVETKDVEFDVVTSFSVRGIVKYEKFSEYPSEQVTTGTDPPLRTLLEQVW